MGWFPRDSAKAAGRHQNFGGGFGGDDAMPMTMVIVLRERHFDRELQETAARSFDDLIGTKQYRCWNTDTERFCRLEVDEKLNLFGLLDD